jgi:hypothetical protein
LHIEFFDVLTTGALQQPPGVAASDGGEPCAQGAVLRHIIHALNQDGERKLRYVGGVRRGEPILPRHGKHDPLILVQQESPRPDLALAASPDQVSVRCCCSTPSRPGTYRDSLSSNGSLPGSYEGYAYLSLRRDSEMYPATSLL